MPAQSHFLTSIERELPAPPALRALLAAGCGLHRWRQDPLLRELLFTAERETRLALDALDAIRALGSGRPLQ